MVLWHDFVFFADLSGFMDLFSWEKLASVVTVFSLAIGGALPLWNMARKKHKEKLLAKGKMEIERINIIAKKATEPIERKLDDQVKKQEQLSDKLEDSEKDTKAILSTVRTLAKDLHSFSNDQQKINAKIHFMDGYIRNVDINSTSVGLGGPGLRNTRRYRSLGPEPSDMTNHDIDPNTDTEDYTMEQ